MVKKKSKGKDKNYYVLLILIIIAGGFILINPLSLSIYNGNNIILDAKLKYITDKGVKYVSVGGRADGLYFNSTEFSVERTTLSNMTYTYMKYDIISTVEISNVGKDSYDVEKIIYSIESSPGVSVRVSDISFAVDGFRDNTDDQSFTLDVDYILTETEQGRKFIIELITEDGSYLFLHEEMNRLYVTLKMTLYLEVGNLSPVNVLGALTRNESTGIIIYVVAGSIVFVIVLIVINSYLRKKQRAALVTSREAISMREYMDLLRFRR